MKSEYRVHLLASTLLLGASLVASPALAQDATAAEADQPTDIVVTGSRIASPTLSSASPLQVVNSDAIASTGAANLQDVLLQNPVFGTPSISRTNSNFATSDAGEATVDLRNLGTSRTLVLVNGRRFVSGQANAQAVDLNSIPTPFIDRVEILTGGASSIYGSDAVAGVVNIIYKTHFQGIDANVQSGVSQEGDNLTKQANLTIGGNFGDNNSGNVMVYAGYSKDGSVLSKDRERSAVDQTSVGGGVTGDINDLFTIQRPFYSSFAPQGRFFGAGGATVGTFDSAGNFINGFSTNGTSTRAPDGFNRSAFRTIALPVERYLLATRANYEISPALNVFLEGTFSKSHVETQLEPFPISTAGTNGIFQGSGGYFPVQQRLANGTIFNNPFVPAALLNQLTDVDGDGLKDVSFTRRLTDIANRTSTADRTTYRFVAGAEGEIAKGWKYDGYFNYGRTDDNQTSTGQVNLANFRSALVVTQDANGNLVCADIQARAQGCVPANVFGANTLSTAAANYIRADGNRSAFASQLDMGANISGELGDYWGAGQIGIAIGGEYRKETSAAAFDALSQAGLNGGNAIPNTSGSFNVYEGYGELRVPIITDKPFFKSVELRGAGRVSRYSTVGTVYSWNFGGEYAPSSDIRFRAVRARATRAPNIGELFQGASQTFPTGLNDPCVGVTATSTGALSVNCRAATGVNANIAANTGVGINPQTGAPYTNAFFNNQADVQGVSGFDTGNPNLKQETADTLTVGVVITPKFVDFLRNFTFTADFSKTRIAGAIVSTPRQFILNQCYQSGLPAYCQFITRRPTVEGANSPGSLEFINSGATNSGGVYTSALDFTAAYRQKLGNYGVANIGVTYTHLTQGYTIPLPGADIDYFAGEVGASKDRFLLTVGYEVGGVKIQYRGNYIGPAYLDDQFVLGLFDGDNPVTDRHDPRAKIGAIYYSDLQVSFAAGDHYEFYVGGNNIFNVSPPPIYSNLPGDTTGAETDSGTYDAVGRRFYAGARFRF